MKMNRCHQYQRRVDTYRDDLATLGWSEEFVRSISLDEFEMRELREDWEKRDATEFIKRYEWLGTIPMYATHWYGAYYRGILGGVIIFAVPNNFSKMLGEGTDRLERLIARGASAAWTPRNLGSHFLMWSIRHMVDSTDFRLFTCYSDSEAGERGKIYQALNFYYLGHGAGRVVKCVNPYNGRAVSDRAFRQVSMYKRYARDMGIDLQPEWFSSGASARLEFDRMPPDVSERLKRAAMECFERSTKIKSAPKSKYAFVLGRDRRETRSLRRLFLERNRTYPYPEDEFPTLDASPEEFVSSGEILHPQFNFF